MNKVGIYSLIFSILLIGGLQMGQCSWADDAIASSESLNPPVSGYAMMAWVNSLGIVEQLQTIHRYTQSSDMKATYGLISALNSPYSLARRKASRSLLEKSRQANPSEKDQMIHQLQWALSSHDPMVQKNVIRLIAEAKTPSSESTLRSFFQSADQKDQLLALEALADENQPIPVADLIQKASPYPKVRQTAAEILK